MAGHLQQQAGASAPALPPQFEAIMNNGSGGYFEERQLTRLHDNLLSTVKQISSKSVTNGPRAPVLHLHVQSGVLDGKPIENLHIALVCDKADLRKMCEQFDPQPGDTVAVLVVKDLGRGRLRFRYGVEKSNEAPHAQTHVNW
jgi:hypothetical protein